MKKTPAYCFALFIMLALVASFTSGCDLALNVVNGDSNTPTSSTNPNPNPDGPPWPAGHACTVETDCKGFFSGTGGCNNETGLCEGN